MTVGVVDVIVLIGDSGDLTVVAVAKVVVLFVVVGAITVLSGGVMEVEAEVWLCISIDEAVVIEVAVVVATPVATSRRVGDRGGVFF